MSRLVVERMEASIAGQAVTLTKESGGVSKTLPGHLDITSIVVNTVANPASSEFWKAAALGARYEIRIDLKG